MDKIAKTLAILIPLAILGYLFYSNFLVSQDFTYFYDIGSENDNYLGPASRISDKIIEGDISYRNLTDGLVYFTVPVLKGSYSISVSARFKDDFPEKSKMSFGASDNSTIWHYKYNLIFNETESGNTNGQWLIRETNYDIKENNLAIKNGKLSILFNTPHLYQTQNKTNTYYIPIDWINVTVHKDGWIK